MNQSVVKALKLLDLFSEDVHELSLKEIAHRSNLPKPTVYRLLCSLEDMGFVSKQKDREHDSRYRLGLKLLELGHLVVDQLEIRKIALPYMEDLVSKINEAVHLVIVNQQEAIYIEKVESTKALRLFTKIGKSSPLHIGSGPKLLLAHLPYEEQAKILHNLQVSSNGKQSKRLEGLLDQLQIIQQEGYALSTGEQDPDTTGISYPVYNHRDQVIAALTVSGLSSYFTGENLAKIKCHTLQTAKEISRKLGCKSQLWEERASCEQYL